jgi:predicted transcriptional regulator
MMHLFDSTNLHLLSCWERPHTVQEVSEITGYSIANVYRRLKILERERLVEKTGKQRMNAKPRPIYFSRIQNVSVKLDLNRYFVCVKFKDGMTREEGYSA